MAKLKPNHAAFVNAVKMHGGPRYFDLGGGVTLVPQANPTVAGTQSSPLPLSNLIGNNAYQASLAPTTQYNYAPAVSQASSQALAGYGQLQGTIGQEQTLAAQLAAEGQGQGPNPAQAALAQNTGTNVANQAALMAGQRGAGANAGLIARQAAQQGAATQQGAVGQAATLEAQQQLAAQQGALAAQGQIANQTTNEQGVNNALFGTSAGATNTQNANQIANYGMAQGINAQASQNNANMTGQTAGGIFQGASSLFSMLGAMSEGGEVKDRSPMKMAEGGPVSWVGQYLNSSPVMGEPSVSGSVGSSASLSPVVLQSGNKTQTQQGQSKSPQGGISDPTSSPVQGSAQTVSGVSDSPGAYATAGGDEVPVDTAFAAKGGKVSGRKKVPVMLSPGEQTLSPEEAKKVADGKKDPMSGKKVPGKAKVQGDSLKNDTVPATLEEGGVVVKRSVMNTHDPKKVQQFVQAILAKSGPRRK